MTFYEALSTYEDQPIDVKQYLADKILSDDRKENRFAVNFLDEIQENNLKYPKLYNKLTKEIKMAEGGSIDKDEYIEYMIEDKIINGWDRKSGGFFTLDLPRQLLNYQSSFPTQYTKVLNKIFSDNKLYSIALSNMKTSFLQFLPEESKAKAYTDYCSYLLEQKIDCKHFEYTQNKSESIYDGLRIVCESLEQILTKENENLQFEIFKSFWKNQIIRMFMFYLDTNMFHNLNDTQKINFYTFHMLSIVSYKTQSRDINTFDKIQQKNSIMEDISVRFTQIYNILTQNESIEIQQKIYDFLGKQDIVEHTFKEINKSIIKRYVDDGTLFTNSEKMFYQKTNIEHNLGIQGWRFHIIADTNLFYHKILAIIFNEYFNKRISEFKMLNPELLISVNDLQQNPELSKKMECGKEFTIYIGQNTKYDYDKSFNDLFYFKNRKKAKNDLNVGGIVNIRYGFYSGLFQQKRKGVLYAREHIIKPKELSEVINLRNTIINSYYQHNDYKRYLQNMFIYNLVDDNTYYLFSEKLIDPKYIGDIYNAYQLMVKSNPNNAFIFEITQVDGYYYIVCDISDTNKLKNFQDFYNAKGYIIQDYSTGTQSLLYPEELTKKENVLTQNMINENYGLQANKEQKKGFFKKKK